MRPVHYRDALEVSSQSGTMLNPTTYDVYTRLSEYAVTGTSALTSVCQCGVARLRPPYPPDAKPGYNVIPPSTNRLVPVI